jgi:nicotinamidase-related amidase
MTTLSNRPNSALLVIDVQNGVVANAHDRDAVVGNIGTLVDKARDAGVEVVWIQHNSDHLKPDSEPWQYGAPPPDKVIAHTNLYWQYHEAPGRTAGTVSTAEVDFGG